MDDQSKQVYSELVRYYSDLEKATHPADKDKWDLIKDQLALKMLIQLKEKKIRSCELDKTTCTEILRLRDLINDSQLYYSLSDISGYTKEYTDEEIESDEDLKVMKGYSLEDIDGYIYSTKSHLWYFQLFTPLMLTFNLVMSHKDNPLCSIVEIMPSIEDNEEYDGDILLEMCHNKIDEISDNVTGALACEYKDYLDELKQLYIRIFSTGEKDNITEIIEDLHKCSLLSLIFYYGDIKYTDFYTPKERKTIGGLCEECLMYLKGQYPNQRGTELLKSAWAFLDGQNTIKHRFLTIINECTEFEWLRDSVNSLDNNEEKEENLTENPEQQQFIDKSSGSNPWIGTFPSEKLSEGEIRAFCNIFASMFESCNPDFVRYFFWGPKDGTSNLDFQHATNPRNKGKIALYIRFLYQNGLPHGSKDTIEKAFGVKMSDWSKNKVDNVGTRESIKNALQQYNLKPF